MLIHVMNVVLTEVIVRSTSGITMSVILATLK